MGIYCSVLVALAMEIMYTFFTKTGFSKKSLDMALFLFNCLIFITRCQTRLRYDIYNMGFTSTLAWHYTRAHTKTHTNTDIHTKHTDRNPIVSEGVWSLPPLETHFSKIGYPLSHDTSKRRYHAFMKLRSYCSNVTILIV